MWLITDGDPIDYRIQINLCHVRQISLIHLTSLERAFIGIRFHFGRGDDVQDVLFQTLDQRNSALETIRLALSEDSVVIPLS